MALVPLATRGLSLLGQLLGRGQSIARTAGGPLGGAFRQLPAPVRRGVSIGAQGLGLGAGFEVGGNLLGGGGGGGGMVQGPLSEISPGMIFPTGEVIGKVWSTNGQFNNMAQTLDGKKGVALRNDGTVRIFRYQKHLVISRNPRARDVARASKRLDRLMSGLVKSGTTSRRAKSKTK